MKLYRKERFIEEKYENDTGLGRCGRTLVFSKPLKGQKIVEKWSNRSVSRDMTCDDTEFWLNAGKKIN